MRCALAALVAAAAAPLARVTIAPRQERAVRAEPRSTAVLDLVERFDIEPFPDFSAK